MNNQDGADIIDIVTCILAVFSTAILLLGVYAVLLATA